VAQAQADLSARVGALERAAEAAAAAGGRRGGAGEGGAGLAELKASLRRIIEGSADAPGMVRSLREALDDFEGPVPELTAVPAGPAGRDRVLLFLRREGEAYLCCGRLAAREVEEGTRPVAFEFELLDFDRLARSESFRELLGKHFRAPAKTEE